MRVRGEGMPWMDGPRRVFPGVSFVIKGLTASTALKQPRPLHFHFPGLLQHKAHAIPQATELEKRKLTSTVQVPIWGNSITLWFPIRPGCTLGSSS